MSMMTMQKSTEPPVPPNLTDGHFYYTYLPDIQGGFTEDPIFIWYFDGKQVRSPAVYDEPWFENGSQWIFKPMTLYQISKTEDYAKKHWDKRGWKAWKKFKKLREHGRTVMADIFNKEFVSCMWDKSLIGKEGFFANEIDQLKDYVNQKYEAMYNKCHPGNDRYQFCDPSEKSYRFFYYDPYYNEKYAYFIEKKWLQQRDIAPEPNPHPWEDLNPKLGYLYTPDLFKHPLREFRIKPEDKDTAEVNVDIKVDVVGQGKIKVVVNGKEYNLEHVPNV